MNTKNTIVCFHVGRGGRFNNPGYVSYLGYTTPQEMFNRASDRNWLFDNPENWFDIKDEIGDCPNLLEIPQQRPRN